MILTNSVVLLCLTHRVLADCGEPGSSKSAQPDRYMLNPVQHYSEGYVISYDCPTTMAGSYARTCKNGKWTEVIPKCRKSRFH